MDHVRIEDDNLIERYLLGQLAAAEVARFEDHYLDCPECLEKLEFSRRLRDGLKEVAAEDGAQLARTAVLAWLLRRGRAFQAGMVVALLTLAVLPLAFLAPQMARLSGESERLAGELARALSPQARTPVYSLSPERSGLREEPSTRITLRSAPEWVVLALQLPPFQSPFQSPTSTGAKGFRVRLFGAEAEPLWQSGPLEADASGRVTLSVHSTWLEAADYHLELDALAEEGETGPVARFAFRVRRGE